MRKKYWLILGLSLVLVASLVLSVACGETTPTPTTPTPTTPTPTTPTPTTPTPAPSVELKYAMPTGSPTSARYLLQQHILDEIGVMTEGRVTVKAFPGGTLLGPFDIMDGVQKGIADFGEFTGGWMSMDNLPLLLLHVQLFVYEDKAGTIRCLTYEDTIDDIFTEYVNAEGYDNVIFLATDYNGAHQWAFKGGSERLEPKTPDDFKGLKIRVGGHLADILSKYYGIEVVVMPPTEIYEALERGMIDGTMANSALGNWIDMGWADVAKWQIQIDWHPVCFSYIVNKSTFEKLAPTDQVIVHDAIEWMGNMGAMRCMAEEIECLRLTAAKGVKIYKPTADVMALWNDEAKVAAYLSDWQEAVGGDWVKQVLAVVKKYNEDAPVDWSIFGL